MVAVSGNTGLAPLIGSNVIRDRASDESVWREKGPSDMSYARARPVLRPPVRGGPDVRME